MVSKYGLRFHLSNGVKKSSLEYVKNMIPTNFPILQDKFSHISVIVYDIRI